MLRKWHPSISTNYMATVTSATELGEDSDVDDIPSWLTEGNVKPTLGDQLSKNQRQELQSLLSEFGDLFKTYPGHTTMAEHKIVTEDNAAIHQPPYRLPYAWRGQVEQELKDMLEQGIIEPSSSDWASPLLPVGKKDGTLRLCVDYRRLNAISKMDAYPIIMPRVEDVINSVGTATFISKIDLTKGYWQVPAAVREGDREKTALSSPLGLFQFRRMPFGLQGAPATFQRMIDKVLESFSDFSNGYIDDIDVVVFSSSFEHHLDHLRRVLQSIRQARLTIRSRKCQFGMSYCHYLGHIVGGGQVQPEEAKITAIRDFPLPKTKKGVRSFLGLTRYYRKFIPDYSSLTAPLSNLTRKQNPNVIVWTPDCEHAFKELKRVLCSPQVLCTPDFTKPFVLQTDASDRGVGAVLSQLDDTGRDRPIAYFSKKLLPRETKYSTVEKECLAIKLGVQHFRTYLMGYSFEIETDHRALE